MLSLILFQALCIIIRNYSDVIYDPVSVITRNYSDVIYDPVSGSVLLLGTILMLSMILFQALCYY